MVVHIVQFSNLVYSYELSAFQNKTKSHVTKTFHYDAMMVGNNAPALNFSRKPISKPTKKRETSLLVSILRQSWPRVFLEVRYTTLGCFMLISPRGQIKA